MPNSSRRKQSKPQHLPSEEEEGNVGNDLNQAVTSSCPPGGVENTQEDKYGSKVTGLNLQKNGDGDIEDQDKDQDTSEINGQELIKMTEISGKVSIPCEFNGKLNFTEDSDNINDENFDNHEDTEGDGLVPMYDPPAAHLIDRFCSFCNTMKKSPADLERHLRKHTGDKPFCCEDCTKQFKSKRSLQYHQYMSHDKQPVDGNIAHRYEFLRKRRLEESLLKSPSKGEADTKSIGETSSLEAEPLEKRKRIDDTVSQQSLYNSAINTGSSTNNGFDLRIPKSTDTGHRFTSENESQDVTRVCPVCTKVFPKPSDLKRHMMCHTGEKPFRCEYCNKPFRAKSSMHYHLKAAHGVQIELSPGLEERYLRMRTRASLGYFQRGQHTDASLLRMDNHMDIDDIEEDCESTDSSYFHTSGIGSDNKDTKSQGQFDNTGNEGKAALDLTMSSLSKERIGDSMAGQLGDNIIQTESPFKKSRISIQNETVLVTRLDGLDMVNGQNTSIYKCYLCGKMFHSMSKLQCHLSLHFERQVVTYECCFCEDIFQFKTQLQNHIRRQHSSQLNKSKDTNENPGNLTSSSHYQNDNQLDNQYSCRYCRKLFNTKISLNKHMRLHFWNRNCFCRICGKSFSLYTSLQLHMSRFHWKTIGKSAKSSLRRKINFFNTYRFKPESHDGVPEIQNDEPLDLIKNKGSRPVNGNLAVFLPKSPIPNGDQSDTGASRHSSENNLSGYMSSDMYETEDGAEIKTAPKRSLMPFLKAEGSPRLKTHRKSTPNHLKNQTQLTSDNNIPLNFIKSESTHQDSNNNESVSNSSQPNLEKKGLSSVSEPLIPGYNMNATNHLLMAKALAAHQTLSHFTNTSQPMIFPPNHLPPSLAAMTQMMTLPVSVPSLSSETVANTSQSPSPASHTSSKSDTSPEDRELSKDASVRDSMLGFPRVQWAQGKPDNWTFNMYSPADPGHTDGRKVSSLSRTHSRLGIVHTPINREAVCKPMTLTDGRTVYKCPFCSKEFVSFSDINRHMDFHEGKKDIRPYKCQYCDYYARTNSQLKVHMMRHQGIREYCCKLCNYKGVTQSDLNRHMKSQIHMLKARNACTYCGEGFVTTKNLEKHLDGNCIVKMQKLNGGLDLPLAESIA